MNSELQLTLRDTAFLKAVGIDANDVVVHTETAARLSASTVKAKNLGFKGAVPKTRVIRGGVNTSSKDFDEMKQAVVIDDLKRALKNTVQRLKFYNLTCDEIVALIIEAYDESVI